jgi:7-cyano-7-deazaguanine synthase
LTISTNPPPRAVVLLSGGLDSATALAIARDEGFEAYALTVAYGQRHAIERQAARRVAASLGVAAQVELEIDMRPIGGSALTSDQIDVPRDRDSEAMGHEIPVTYVPARNTVFLSLALGWAEVLGAFDIFVGVNCVDYSGYPDCRPAFLRAFEATANLATAAGVEGRGRFRIHAPLIHWTKDAIIRRGLELGVDYGLTHSCYDPTPEGRACGRCDSCCLRLEAFARVGRPDPVAYSPTNRA